MSVTTPQSIADWLEKLGVGQYAQRFVEPDLATNDGQRLFDDAIGDSEVVILDNVSTLYRSGKENEAESWQGVQDLDTNRLAFSTR